VPKPESGVRESAWNWLEWMLSVPRSGTGRPAPSSGLTDSGKYATVMAMVCPGWSTIGASPGARTAGVPISPGSRTVIAGDV